MPHYQIMTIASTGATKESLSAMFQRFAQAIHVGGGVFTRVDHLGARPLAFRMRAHTVWHMTGRYIRFDMIASPPLLADIEKRLNVEHNIIRFLITKVHQMNNRRDDEHDETLITADNAPSTTLSLIQATSSIDYYVARALLSFGALKRADILALPRRRDDSEWNKARQSHSNGDGRSIEQHDMQSGVTYDEPPQSPSAAAEGSSGGALSTERGNSRALVKAFNVRESFASELSTSTAAIMQYHKFRQRFNNAAEAARERFSKEEIRLSEVRVDYLATTWIAEHCRKQVRAEFREFRRIGKKKDADWSAQRMQQLIKSKQKQLDRYKQEKMKGIFDQRTIQRAANRQDQYKRQSQSQAKEWTDAQTQLMNADESAMESQEQTADAR